jgi:hypothetical protein
MNEILQTDFHEVGHIYFVSNTPTYLVRYLRENAAVQHIAKTYSADIIFDALRESLKEPPQDVLHEAVPYALLVALDLKQARDSLQKTSALKTAPWKWFDYIRRYLAMSATPVSITSVSVGQVPSSPETDGSPTKISVVSMGN